MQVEHLSLNSISCTEEASMVNNTITRIIESVWIRILILSFD